MKNHSIVNRVILNINNEFATLVITELNLQNRKSLLSNFCKMSSWFLQTSRILCSSFAVFLTVLGSSEEVILQNHLQEHLLVAGTQNFKLEPADLTFKQKLKIPYTESERGKVKCLWKPRRGGGKLKGGVFGLVGDDIREDYRGGRWKAIKEGLVFYTDMPKFKYEWKEADLMNPEKNLEAILEDDHHELFSAKAKLIKL